MSTSHPSDTSTARIPARQRWRSLLTVLILLGAGVFASLQLSNSWGEAHSHAQVEQLNQQLLDASAELFQHLLLSNDRISLNYMLNELSEIPTVAGMTLTDSEGRVLGTAGRRDGTALSRELIRSGERLGELRIYADPRPIEALIQERQQWLLMGTATSTLLALLGLWISLRPPRPAATETGDESTTADDSEPDFDQVLAQTVAQSSNPDDEIPEIDFAALELDPPTAAAPITTPTPTRVPEPEPHFTPVASRPVPATEEEQVPSRAMDSHPAEPALDETDDPIPTLNLDALEEDDVELSTQAREPEMEEADTEVLDDRELVSLLRPEREKRVIPSFTPMSSGLSARRDEDEFDSDSLSNLFAASDDVELNEAQERTDADERVIPFTARNPLLNSTAEEQLNLYGLDQDLELMLSAEEAGYLLLIDTTSAHAEYTDAGEHERLMKVYRLLASSVAAIYSGTLSSNREGDLLISFDEASADDAHGINAVCAAMLFAELYRQYNQTRIRRFSPVLNLHLGLVRGHRQRLERLQEEARFLTRTTQSNDVISHTALTEAPDLKRLLFTGASIRREDEDKVLLLRLADSYQQLLDKQARHLLTQLQQREAGRDQSGT